MKGEAQETFYKLPSYIFKTAEAMSLKINQISVIFYNTIIKLIKRIWAESAFTRLIF